MTSTTRRQTFLGLLFALMAALSFGGMGYFVHASSGIVPSSELGFARGVLGMAVLLPLCWRDLPKLLERKAAWVWLRAATAAIAMLMFYWNLQHASIGTAKTLMLMSQILVVLAGWSIFKERLTLRELLAMGVIVGGATALYLPGSATPPVMVTVIGLSGAALGATAYVSLRQAAQRFRGTLVVFCLSFCLTLAAPFAPDGAWVMPVGADWVWPLGVALTGLVAQLFLTRAMTWVPAAIVTGISLSSLIWGVLLDVSLDGARPSVYEWVGYGVILAGVLGLQWFHGRSSPSRNNRQSAGRSA